MTYAFDSNGNPVRIAMDNGVERVRDMRPWLYARRIEDRLCVFIPTERQFQRAAAWLIRASETAERILEVAAILAAIFIAAEVAIAFLPGGAVERVIGGGQ